MNKWLNKCDIAKKYSITSPIPEVTPHVNVSHYFFKLLMTITQQSVTGLM